ncbi:MAG TPA: histidine--tRNA ligase [Candidatus Portnoybacteria bacterium]|jgi:histidyl-tRNA synthetase|nr:histidine--tRNA ligase [Candidatus Portnoybacteria bacterium]MDD5751975.1 histidine--tRNA ligase [Candidatus Portnoybacteria bacterium]HNU96641.1 histidine--tRNA ligase [Candidatus Portnoybacteria bacterium]HOZ16221.1 histidine--tRNA ligase [Candidatus Portnoybacteria bacterium]HPH51984.1 histidine--tRNA ligase [Candidatus Portnoybacteria bacterium]
MKKEKKKRGRPSKPKKPKISKIKIQAAKGVHDILPDEQKYWGKLYSVVAQVLPSYGFRRIDVPIFEDARLYLKGTGQSTDIVQKEMYTFKKGDAELFALRPEFTPGIVRAYIEHGMKNLPQPVKLYTTGPLFRHDKPQAGRFRQFHQINWEILGDQSAVSDVQIIQSFISILKKINLKKYTLYINSIGCPICIPKYKKALTSYYHQHLKNICPDCNRRFKENPLRLLDCKNNKCEHVIIKAPQTLDYLCEECHKHFKEVLEYLDDLEIPYHLNPQLVRGLDYYTKTVFEFYEDTKINASQGALMGGGRYDNLVEMFKGKPTPGVGAAAGIERLINVVKKQDVKVAEKEKPKVFLIQLGEMGRKKCLKLFEEFQSKGVNVGEAFSKPSIKAQLKVADKEGVDWALIMGQREALEDTIIIKDMKTGAQETIRLDRVVGEIKKRIEK